MPWTNPVLIRESIKRGLVWIVTEVTRQGDEIPDSGWAESALSGGLPGARTRSVLGLLISFSSAAMWALVSLAEDTPVGIGHPLPSAVVTAGSRVLRPRRLALQKRLCAFATIHRGFERTLR